MNDLKKSLKNLMKEKMFKELKKHKRIAIVGSQRMEVQYDNLLTHPLWIEPKDRWPNKDDEFDQYKRLEKLLT